jgi:hypothetical protein
MFVSITRLRVRSIRYLPQFLWTTNLAMRQVVRSAGFRRGRLLADAHRTYWTVTIWENEKEMKAYRGAQAHGKAMPRLAGWCDEAAYTHWEQEGDSPPSWDVVWERLVEDGRLSRVAHPSSGHEARIFPKPRLKPMIGTDLKPAL